MKRPSRETLLLSVMLLSAEAPEDGDGDASSVGYGGSSPASGTHSRILYTLQRAFFFFVSCRVAGTSSRWVSHLCHSMLAWHVHTPVSVVFTLGPAESSQTPAACWKQRGLLKTAHSSSDGEILVCFGFFKLSKNGLPELILAFT